MKRSTCRFCGKQLYFDDAALRSYHQAPVCPQYAALCAGATREAEVTIIDVPGTEEPSN
jgi:hypothetical protein